MSTFPTLSIPPVYPIKEDRADRAIKSKTEAGYTITRARYSKVRKIFDVQYENMNSADKVLFDALLDAVKETVDYFSWTHPATGTTYTVRFDETPKPELSRSDGSDYYYAVSFRLIEV